MKLTSEIGTELQLEIERTEGRVRTVLVGVISDDMLILQITEKLADVISQLDALPVVTLRGISRGQAFGFKSQALRCISNPTNLMLIEYPESIQKQDVRRNRRVKCLLPANLTQDNHSVSGVIADLSNSGCHFQTSTDLTNDQTAMLQLEQVVTLSFQLPGLETPKKAQAVVRNTYIEQSTIHLGFEFTEVDNVTASAMEEFISLSFDIQPF
ncbi:MAG: PilZ domain-containing protein [Gammaproteobacteria bacterium]